MNTCYTTVRVTRRKYFSFSCPSKNSCVLNILNHLLRLFLHLSYTEKILKVTKTMAKLYSTLVPSLYPEQIYAIIFVLEATLNKSWGTFVYSDRTYDFRSALRLQDSVRYFALIKVILRRKSDRTCMLSCIKSHRVPRNALEQLAFRPGCLGQTVLRDYDRSWLSPCFPYNLLTDRRIVPVS